MAIDDKAVLFSAYNHSGKSSLAASCLQAGHALLADDYAAIELLNQSYVVQPGYPLMRMWFDQAEYFIGNYNHLEDVHANYSKKLVPIGDQGFGRFCIDACHLSVIYIPQRRLTDDPDTAISIKSLPKTTAVTTLIRSGIVSSYRRWLPFHLHNLQQLSKLVNVTPVRQVTYPSGYDLLPVVRDAILADIEHLP